MVEFTAVTVVSVKPVTIHLAAFSAASIHADPVQRRKGARRGSVVVRAGPDTDRARSGIAAFILVEPRIDRAIPHRGKAVGNFGARIHEVDRGCDLGIVPGVGLPVGADDFPGKFGDAG